MTQNCVNLKQGVNVWKQLCAQVCVRDKKRKREKNADENIPGNYQNYVLWGKIQESILICSLWKLSKIKGITFWVYSQIQSKNFMQTFSVLFFLLTLKWNESPEL